MFLEAAVADLDSPIACSSRITLCLRSPIFRRILFAPEIRGHPAEICACAKEQRCEDGGPHHNICDRQTPSTGLACDPANVKAEPNNSVDQRNHADNAKNGSGRSSAEHSCSTRRSKSGA